MRIPAVGLPPAPSRLRPRDDYRLRSNPGAIPAAGSPVAQPCGYGPGTKANPRQRKRSGGLLSAPERRCFRLYRTRTALGGRAGESNGGRNDAGTTGGVRRRGDDAGSGIPSLHGADWKRAGARGRRDRRHSDPGALLFRRLRLPRGQRRGDGGVHGRGRVPEEEETKFLRRGWHHPDHPLFGYEQVSGSLFDSRTERKRMF